MSCCCCNNRPDAETLKEIEEIKSVFKRKKELLANLEAKGFRVRNKAGKAVWSSAHSTAEIEVVRPAKPITEEVY